MRHPSFHISHHAGLWLSISLLPLLSTILFLLTSIVAKQSNFAAESNGFDASSALEVLSVSLAVLGVCTSVSLNTVFELLQWKLVARTAGARPIEILSVSPTTSLRGALTIACWSRLLRDPMKVLKACFTGAWSPKVWREDRSPKAVYKQDRTWAALR
jgi:hypothetical protein